jgi:hypothetical protein
MRSGGKSRKNCEAAAILQSIRGSKVKVSRLESSKGLPPPCHSTHDVLAHGAELPVVVAHHPPAPAALLTSLALAISSSASSSSSEQILDDVSERPSVPAEHGGQHLLLGLHSLPGIRSVTWTTPAVIN